jgi:hypothetical protein
MGQYAVIFAMLVGAFGQTLQVPYEDIEASFTNKRVSHSYSGSFTSIRKIDFRNLSFPTFDDNGNADQIETRLINGHYGYSEPGDYESLDLDSIHYLSRLKTSHGDSALLLFSLNVAGGSSNQWGIADLFVLSGKHLQISQEIKWETHAGGRESFDSATNTLVIRSDRPGGGGCCIPELDVVTFKWDGSRFVQTGIRTELSEYGKRERKTLPTTPNQ